MQAWALARCLDIGAGDVVLDPTCGRGTLLAEAALWWPSARYVGCDLDAGQLEACRANCESLGVAVERHLADASRRLGGVPKGGGSIRIWFSLMYSALRVHGTRQKDLHSREAMLFLFEPRRV